MSGNPNIYAVHDPNRQQQGGMPSGNYGYGPAPTYAAAPIQQAYGQPQPYGQPVPYAQAPYGQPYPPAPQGVAQPPQYYGNVQVLYTPAFMKNPWNDSNSDKQWDPLSWHRYNRTSEVGDVMRLLEIYRKS